MKNKNKDVKNINQTGDLSYIEMQKLINRYNQKKHLLKDIEVTPDMVKEFENEIDKNYLKSDKLYNSLIKLLYYEKLNYFKIQEENNKREQRLYNKINKLEELKGYYYHNRKPNKRLDTKIVKDVQNLEVQILEKYPKWKKTYQYTVIKDLVESVSSLRKYVITALSVDNNYVEIKYQHYMAALSEIDNIEYLIRISYINFNIFTVDEVSSFAIKIDEILQSLNNLMKKLENKKED